MFAPVLQLPVIPVSLFPLFKRERQAGKSEVSYFKLDLMQCQNIFSVYFDMHGQSNRQRAQTSDFNFLTGCTSG